MPPFELLAAFAAATLVFAILPGPALLYTAARTMADGRAGGLRAALGIHIGGAVHVVAAALGLASLFAWAPVLYTVLKFGGAAYLVWIGLSIVLSGRGDTDETDAERTPRGRHGPFVQSVLVEVLNPKTALFFIAFLPQFVDPGATLPVWAQFLILGTIVNLAFSSADLAAVFVTDKAVSWARSSGLAEKAARWVGGSVLIGLGANLAFSRD